MTQRNKSASQSIELVCGGTRRLISLQRVAEFDAGVFCFRLAGDARAETVVPRITTNQDAVQRNDD